MIARCVTALILLAGISAAAQENLPTAAEILENLDQASDALTSFTADFLQEEKDEFGDIVKTSGNVYFLSPGRMMMVSYVKGKKTEEVGKNTEYAWRIRHHVKTVDRFSVDNKDEVSEEFSITNADDLQREYTLEVAGIVELDSGPAYHLVGTSKEKRKISKVEVWVNVANPAPVVKAISHQRRIKTTFTMSNIQREADIEADMFEYKVPANYKETIH